MTVLIASCIRQKPEILREFLESLDKLEKPEHEYFFILSDLEDKSKELFDSWSQSKPVETLTMEFGDPYVTDEDTHHWNSKLVSNVIEMKEKIIKRAGDYDCLLLVDSDTYLHPETLIQLLSRRKDIITEISWTKWYADDPRVLPSAWFYQKYGFPPDGLQQLRNESLVEVGGFGGLYLISKRALEAGVSFGRIEGKPDDWGEDRHFAIRAQSLGFELWCDTTMPSFHIYRMSDLPRLSEWKESGFTEMGKEVHSGGILIAIPHTGVLRAELVAYLLNVVARNAGNKRFRISVDLSWGMPVDSNRNSISKKLLGTDNEWLLTIDSDIGPPPMVLEELMSHGKKVVGAVCWSSMGGEEGGRWESFGIPYPVVMSKNPKGGWNVDRKTVASGKRLVECDAGSTACLLLHREVLEAIEPPWFRLQYDENGVCNAGEDFTFFDKVKAKGYGVYVDLALQCGHYKTVEIKRFNDLLAETERKINV